MGKRYVRWENWEKQIIRDSFPLGGIKECHKQLSHRTKIAIAKQAYKLKVKMKYGKLIDLTGKPFGDWIVIKRGEDYISPKGVHQTQWWCKCNCGAIKLVHRSNLKSGSSLCCGDCNPLIFGKIYNNYVEPIEYVEVYIDPKSDNHSRLIRCRCHYNGLTCKGTFITRAASIKSGNTSSCGCLKRERILKAISGKNHWNWKEKRNCITPLKKLVRASSKYHNLQNTAFNRDNSCCIILGKLPKRKLQIHHIKPQRIIWKENNITTYGEAMACEELWDLDNVVTISEEWHIGVKTPNPLALHMLHNGAIYKKENFYLWLRYILDNRK